MVREIRREIEGEIKRRRRGYGHEGRGGGRKIGQEQDGWGEEGRRRLGRGGWRGVGVPIGSRDRTK